MKFPHKKTSLLAVATLVAASSLHADFATKASTGADLTAAAAWTGGTGAGGTVNTTDTAQWISTSLGGTQTIGSAVTWGALDFEGAASAVTINKVSGVGTLTLNGGQTINGIANSGLVVASTANGTITLGVNLELGANQVWTTDGAKTVTFAPTNTTDLKTFTLDLNISGTASAQGSLNNFNFNSTSVKNGTINANAGANVNFSQNGAGNYSHGTDLIINVNTGSFVRFNGSTSGTQITDYAAEIHLKGGTLLFSGGNATTPTLAATGKLIVDNNSTISTQSSGSGSPTTVIAAAISGAGNLTIAPTSVRPAQNVILTNANSGYSGAWTLTAPGATGPTLTLADGGALGDGSVTNTVTLGTATTLAFTNATGPLSVANAIGGAGQLTKSGAGMVTLSGSNTYTGATTVNAGYLAFNPGAVSTGSTITVNGNGAVVASGAMTQVSDWLNASNFSTASTGTIAITGNSSEDIDFATRGFNSLGLSSTGTATYSGTITAGTGGYKFGGDAGTLTVSSNLTQATTLTKIGASTVVLSGNNNYSGTTTVNGGTLSITGTNSAGGAVTVSNGILNLQNSNALGTSVVTAITRSSGIQLQGGITLPGTVTFVTSNDGTSTVPYAIANVSGDNTINGTISLMTGGGASVIQSDSGSLTLAGNISIAAGQTSRGIILQGASTGANTVSGVLSDLSPSSVASITKNGAGTWTVSGANTYTGATTVNAGTLLINGNNGAATGALSVVAAATLGGTGTIGASLATVNGNITGGTATTVGTLNTSALTLGATGVYLAQIDSGALTADRLTVTGALTLTGGSLLSLSDLGTTPISNGTKLTIASYGSLTGTFNGIAEGHVFTIGSNQWQIAYADAGSSITLTAVPEPSTYGLIGAGALAAVAFVRRRRKAADIDVA